MRRGLIIVAALLIIVIVGVALALSTTVSDKTLTARELDRINQSCIACHEDDLTGSGIHSVHIAASCFSCHDSSHTVHAGADCQDCHTGTTGLETADTAYNILKLVGIGGAGSVVFILALNFFVSRQRQRKRED